MRCSCVYEKGSWRRGRNDEKSDKKELVLRGKAARESQTVTCLTKVAEDRDGWYEMFIEGNPEGLRRLYLCSTKSHSWGGACPSTMTLDLLMVYRTIVNGSASSRASVVEVHDRYTLTTAFKLKALEGVTPVHHFGSRSCMGKAQCFRCLFFSKVRWDSSVFIIFQRIGEILYIPFTTCGQFVSFVATTSKAHDDLALVIKFVFFTEFCQIHPRTECSKSRR